MLFPAFGKNGYLIFSGFEVPIYMWNYSYNMERTNYRTSNSNMLPVRNNGVFSNTLSISGVEYEPGIITNFLSSNFLQTFEIGWINFIDSTRNYIDYTGMVDSIELIFNYGKPSEGSFIWTVTYSGCRYLNELQERPLDLLEDHVVCSTHPCEIGAIVTTDVSIGALLHVDKVSIKILAVREPYLTSQYPNMAREVSGVLDKQITLSLNGDFDYWMDQINSNTAHTYSFFYTPLDSWDISGMKVSQVNNIVVDVMSSAIISANVLLTSGL